MIDFASWVAGPGAATILADWGADVIKVEPPRGDPFRMIAKIGPDGVNAAFELDNRGKRGIALDVGTASDRELLTAMLARADVFITNQNLASLGGLGLGPGDLRERYPSLVVATVSGFGHTGPDRDRPSYDVGGFWARTGAASAHIADGGPPPLLRPAFGDHMTALALVSGITAALFARQTTGKGTHVSSSLLRTGLYALGQDANVYLRTGHLMINGRGRDWTPNPLFNCFRTSDGRWLWLLGLQPQRHWPLIAVALDHPEWLEDERFTTFQGFIEHSPALIAMLDEAFAARALDEWTTILTEVGVWFEPVLTLPEALAQDQADAAGCVITVPGGTATPRRGLATPVDFDGISSFARRGVPELAEHADEILREHSSTAASSGVTPESPA